MSDDELNELYQSLVSANASERQPIVDSAIERGASITTLRDMLDRIEFDEQNK